MKCRDTLISGLSLLKPPREHQEGLDLSRDWIQCFAGASSVDWLLAKEGSDEEEQAMSEPALRALRAVATDYDGTLAWDGVVLPSTLEALQYFKKKGGALLMVTGRELPDLFRTFPHVDLFDRIVAENGALLYRPATTESIPLGEPPPWEFAQALVRKGVHPVSVGKVIISTVQPHEIVVLETIRELGLELEVIFNKGAVMILPSGINKASGLKVALAELGLSRQEVAGIGDAENDHAFLELCGLSAAVANALPALKARADFVTQGDHGAGVAELITKILNHESPGD